MKRTDRLPTAARTCVCLTTALLVLGCSDPVGTPVTAETGRLFVVTNLNSVSRIYTVMPDGSDLQLVSGDLTSAHHPTWAPDRRRFAFVVDARIYIANADGSDTTKIHHDPTWRTVILHVRLIQEADLAYPIIVSASGDVMDGMHRVAKAVLEGRQEIEAVQFDRDPPPDHVGRGPNDLPGVSASGVSLGGTATATYDVPPGTAKIAAFGGSDAQCRGAATLAPVDVEAVAGRRHYLFAYGTGGGDLRLLSVPGLVSP